jgi:hypothetical protein
MAFFAVALAASAEVLMARVPGQSTMICSGTLCLTASTMRALLAIGERSE